MDIYSIKQEFSRTLHVHGRGKHLFLFFFPKILSRTELSERGIVLSMCGLGLAIVLRACELNFIMDCKARVISTQINNGHSFCG